MITLLGTNCKTITQGHAPFKTGNLRHNAITWREIDNGFQVIVLYFVARYIHFLEEGTKRSKKHIGWFGRKSAVAQTEYINLMLSGNEMEANAVLYESTVITEKTKFTNLPARNKVMLENMRFTAQFTLGG